MAWTSEIANSNDSLPTLKQWLKTVGKEALEVTYLIKLIWLPNLYPNISLDTEAFRLRLNEGHFLHTVVLENIEDWVDNDRVMGLQIDSKIPLKITLLELERDQATWEELGDHGFKLGKVSARSKKNVTSKTRTKVETPPASPEQAAEGASE